MLHELLNLREECLAEGAVFRLVVGGFHINDNLPLQCLDHYYLQADLKLEV